MGLALAAAGMLVASAKAKIVASNTEITLFIADLHHYFLQEVR